VNRRAETHRRIEEEIRREKASALGRAGERLEAALVELSAIDAALDRVADPTERERLLERHEAARQRASRARFALLIQREAIGVHHHAVVDQLFPEPPRRRAQRGT
jgi:hypothetical protein